MLPPSRGTCGKDLAPRASRGAADQFSVLGEGSARSGPKSPPEIPRAACKMIVEKSHGWGVFLLWRGQLWRLDSRPGRGAACQQGPMGYQPRVFHAGWCSQHRQSVWGSLRQTEKWRPEIRGLGLLERGKNLHSERVFGRNDATMAAYELKVGSIA